MAFVMVNTPGMAASSPMPRAPPPTVSVPVKLFEELLSTQAVPPSTLMFRGPPLSASTLVIWLTKGLLPRSQRYFRAALLTMSLATLVRMSGPVPSAWICAPALVPVVALIRILRSEVSPGPTYWRVALLVEALPMVTALESSMVTPAWPTLDSPATVLLPSEVTTRAPELISVTPV